MSRLSDVPSVDDWPGEERRRPRLSTPQWAVRAPLAAWLEQQARRGRHGLPRARRRLRPEAVLPVLRRARERVRRGRRRSAAGGRARGTGRGASRRGRRVRPRPLHTGARALRRPRASRQRAAPRDRARRPRARVHARRPGLPPVAAGLLALDLRRPRAPLRRERRLGVGRGDSRCGNGDVPGDAARDLHGDRAAALGARARAGVAAEPDGGGARRAVRIASRAAAGLADGELPSRRDGRRAPRRRAPRRRRPACRSAIRATENSSRARRLPASPSAGRARGRSAASSSAAATPSTSPASTSMPVSPSATTSGTALTRVATTGRPASIASSRTIPKPSQREVCTKTSARSSQSRMSVRPGRATASSRPSSPTSRRVSASSGPLAEDREPRLAARALRTRANARSSVA